MLKIHGIARSRAFRCIWAAEEAGLAYEVIPKQTNNGAWCRIEELNAEVINVVYDYLLTNLK